MVMSKLLDAAAAGEVEILGRLVGENDVLAPLSRVPPEHLKTHRVEILTAMMRLDHGFVHTYDPKVVEPSINHSLMKGCYTSLLVGREVKALIPKWLNETAGKPQ